MTRSGNRTSCTRYLCDYSCAHFARRLPPRSSFKSRRVVVSIVALCFRLFSNLISSASFGRCVRSFRPLCVEFIMMATRRRRDVRVDVCLQLYSKLWVAWAETEPVIPFDSPPDRSAPCVLARWWSSSSVGGIQAPAVSR